MSRLSRYICSGSFIILSLAIQLNGQTQASKREQLTGATTQTDLSTWKAVSLADRGIKFKLPPEWRHDGSDLERKNDRVSIAEVEWHKPNDDMTKIELIRIVITTIKAGFFSDKGAPASEEQMGRQKYDSLIRHKEDHLQFIETKQLAVSGVKGVFSVLLVNSQDKAIGVREGILWIGYRFYRGQPQEIEITISATPKSDVLLRTIFSTLEVEHDRMPGSKRQRPRI